MPVGTRARAPGASDTSPRRAQVEARVAGVLVGGQREVGVEPGDEDLDGALTGSAPRCAARPRDARPVRPWPGPRSPAAPARRTPLSTKCWSGTWMNRAAADTATGPSGASSRPIGAREHLAPLDPDDLRLDVQHGSDRHGAPEVALQPAGHRRARPSSQFSGAEDLVDRGGEQPAVGEARSTLMVLRRREHPGHAQPLPGGDLHVQAGRVLGSAAEAPAVVRRDRRAGGGRVRGPQRQDGIRRRRGGQRSARPVRAGARVTVAGHARDPTRADPISQGSSRMAGWRRGEPRRVHANGSCPAGGRGCWPTRSSAMIAVAYGAALGRPSAGSSPSADSPWRRRSCSITAPTIEVVRRPHLSVGGATLPVTSIGEVEAVDRAIASASCAVPARTARLFVSLRPWSGADGVLVRLDDPEDPHPAWLFTSRHPARVVAALAATMDR